MSDDLFFGYLYCIVSGIGIEPLDINTFTASRQRILSTQRITMRWGLALEPGSSTN